MVGETDRKVRCSGVERVAKRRSRCMLCIAVAVQRPRLADDVGRDSLDATQRGQRRRRRIAGLHCSLADRKGRSVAVSSHCRTRRRHSQT